MGCLCAFLARARGRSAFGWFLVGLVAPVVGVILVLVLPDEQRRRELQVENRRLREQMRMDKTVADRRQREIERRLEQYDEALGLDTKEAHERLDDEPQETPAASELEPARAEPVVSPPAAETDDIRWYYARNGRESESIDIVELRDLWRSGEVRADTLIWNKYLTSWKTIGAVAGLMEELNA